MQTVFEGGVCVDMFSVYGRTKQSAAFNRTRLVPLPLFPHFLEFPWMQFWLPAPGRQARVGPNGKHTFLITGPLADFLLSNAHPEQWKTNSSRKLGAMNYQTPNKYVSEGNGHPTVLREGVAGHGWFPCFFFQGIWALFLYIALRLSSTSGSLLIERWWGFFWLPPCHFSLWRALVLPVSIKKIIRGRISLPALPLAMVSLGWRSPCLPQFPLWDDIYLPYSILII